MNDEILKKYETGGDVLRQSIKGLQREDLVATPVPGTWSIQQIVIHLADAEAAFADRIKRIIAEDGPKLLAWDQDKFVQRLHYQDQSAEDAVALIDLTRRQVARILRKLPADAFARVGEHSERGRQTLADVIEKAVSHAEHHLKFIIDKREKLGKLMW